VTNWTDDRIERAVTEWLRERTTEPVPESVYERAHRVATRRPIRRVFRSWLALAAVIAVVGGGGLLAATGLGQRPVRVTEPPRPTTTQPVAQGSAMPSPSPAESLLPSALASEPAQEPGPPNLAAVAFFDAAHGLIGGGLSNGTDSATNPAEGAIWRTSDGGRTWLEVASKTPPIMSLATVGTTQAWASAACVDGSCRPVILSSSDGGRTWRTISSVAASSMTFVDREHGWAVAPGGPSDPGGLLVTATGGSTWQPRPAPCPFGRPTAVAFVSLDRGWVGCTRRGASTNAKAVLETVDGGRSWHKRALVDIPGGLASHGSIDFFDDLDGLFMRGNGTGMWWGGRGTTQRTTDGGLNWLSGPPGSPDVTIEAGGWAIDDRTWFMVGWDGNSGSSLQQSTDAGKSWESVGTLP
jgi:photosystem II stability/assembly factor-like uncharacterized protein